MKVSCSFVSCPYMLKQPALSSLLALCPTKWILPCEICHPVEATPTSSFAYIVASKSDLFLRLHLTSFVSKWHIQLSWYLRFRQGWLTCFSTHTPGSWSRNLHRIQLGFRLRSDCILLPFNSSFTQDDVIWFSFLNTLICESPDGCVHSLPCYRKSI